MTAAEHDRELRSRLYGWLAARTSTPGGDEWEHGPLRLLVVDLLDLIEGYCDNGIDMSDWTGHEDRMGASHVPGCPAIAEALGLTSDPSRVVRIHYGNPDAHAESWCEGWDEAHAQGVGGQESREWVTRRLRAELARGIDDTETDDQLAGRLADAVLSDADLSEPTAEAQQGDFAETLTEMRRLLARARVVADAIAEGETVDEHFRRSCAVLGQHIADMVGHSVTDQPPSGALEALADALTARPSADAETLRRVRALADYWDSGDDVRMPHGPIARQTAARDLRAALDGQS